jgi:rod shape-determining protein MreC
MRLRFSKKHLVVFLVLIVGLIFLNIFPKISDFLENLVFKAFSPVQKLFINTGNRIIGFFEIILSIKDLNLENTELKKKNLELEAELTAFKETEKENQVLREALNFSQKNIPLYEMAYVVGKETQGGENWILINKGFDRGVVEDTVIVSEEFSLVGKIVEVYDDFSKATLIIGSGNAVAALIENKRSEGLVQKEESGNKIFMDFIPKEENPEVGEKVLTSGMDKIYPAGIFIGKIESVDSSENQLFTKVVIAPAANFSKLEKVLIIKTK